MLVLGVVTLRREFFAGALLLIAVMTREFTIVAPALAALMLLAQSVAPRREWFSILRRTRALWTVAVVVGATRLALGAASYTGPYRVQFLGKHLATNLFALLKIAGRFGAPSTSLVLNAWVVLFWTALIAGVVWSLRRGNRLPAVGLLWFFVSLLPFIVLPNHGTVPYYLALPGVGLALTLASLLEQANVGVRALAASAILFVSIQIVAVHAFDTGSVKLAIDRSKVMVGAAKTIEERNGSITFVTHCPRDKELSRDGDLFRVVLGQPGLRVVFRVVDPASC
jgi:hypothetical protein